jgi:hypothetical protein
MGRGDWRLSNCGWSPRIRDDRDHLVESGAPDEPRDCTAWCIEDQVAPQLALALASGDQRGTTGAIHELSVAQIDKDHSTRLSQIGQRV